MMKLLLSFALALPTSAAETVFHSGPARTRLIELYSSEGCSSCPPADAWVAPLTTHARLWKDFVPVVFHVDYWDYLGWKDRFASPAWSARQREWASSRGNGSTYTPGFVLDGEEWHGWGGAAPGPGEIVGALEARVVAGNLRVRFVPVKDEGPYEVFAARLGFGLESVVADGENAGRTLRHEFVVRSLSRARMKSKDRVWTAELPFAPGPSERAGAAVWLIGPHGRPVQAAGGFLP
jgi:hypothetical protein